MSVQFDIYSEFVNKEVRQTAIDIMFGFQNETYKLIKEFGIIYHNEFDDLDNNSVLLVIDSVQEKMYGCIKGGEIDTLEDDTLYNSIVFVDITSVTGKDELDDYFKNASENEFVDDEEVFQTKLPTDVFNIEVESDKDIDVEFQGVLGEVEVKEKMKNYHKADYSVAGFKKLTESRDGFTPIDEAMEEAGFFDEDDEVDVVNNPSHYNMGDIEVITYIEQQAKVMSESGVPPEVIPHICNAIKYISRFQSKGKPVEDLNKSIYYINRAIKNIEDSKE